MFHNLRIKIHSLKSKIMSSQFTFLSVSILYSVSNEVQFFNRGLHPVHQFFCLVEFRWQENFNYDCNPTTTLHLLLSFFGLPTVAVRFECPRNALFSKKKKKKTHSPQCCSTSASDRPWAVTAASCSWPAGRPRARTGCVPSTGSARCQVVLEMWGRGLITNANDLIRMSFLFWGLVLDGNATNGQPLTPVLRHLTLNFNPMIPFAVANK